MSSEHEEQVALFEWAELVAGRWPQLRSMFAIPNGGKRHFNVGKKLKAEGTKPGVPDVCLPVARGGFHGLYIEMKYGKNKPTAAQKSYIVFLQDRGYAIAICWSFYSAKAIIEWYLNESPTAVVLSGTETTMPAHGYFWSP